MNETDRKLLPLLAGWLDGELSPEERLQVDAALERSPELRAVLAQWQATDAALPRGEVERSEADWEALAMRIDDAVASEASPQQVAALSMAGDAAESTRDFAAVPRKLRRSRTSRAGWMDELRSLLSGRGWAVGGTGALAAVVLIVLLWPGAEHIVTDPAPEALNLPPAAKPSAPAGAGAETDAIANTERIEPPAATEESQSGSDALQKKGRGLRDAPMAPEGVASPPEPPAALPKEPARQLQSEAVEQRADEMQVRGGDTKSIEVRIDGVPEAKSEASSEADSDRALVRAPLPASAPSMSFSTQISQREAAWLAPMRADLDAAVATANAEALRRILADLESRRSEPLDAATQVAVLEVAVRARGEFLRLFPDAPDNAGACASIRADHAAWLSHTDAAKQESTQGRRLHDLVRDVCPE